jgi:hypothetical protein
MYGMGCEPIPENRVKMHDSRNAIIDKNLVMNVYWAYICLSQQQNYYVHT